MGNISATTDTQRYRDGYPGKEEDPSADKNLQFLANKIPFTPRLENDQGEYIDVIHNKWKGDYRILERNHDYIQWLFPIREVGSNYKAQPLQLHEAKTISEDPALQGKIIISYEMMLDFYGMKLADRSTGRIERNHNWKERFNELNCSDHNCLRITRMMKCFGEVGLEHYKFPFVQFVLTEIIENKELAGCFDSCVHFWCGVIRDDQKRKELDNYIIKNMSKLPWAKTGMYQFQNIFVYFHEYANDAK